MTAFVKSIEYVEITLPGGVAVSVNLTKSQTIDDCVPFYTVNLDSSVLDKCRARYVDVKFEAGPKVTAQRGHSDGTAIVGIFVVEYDTSGDISVQQGTFDFLATEGSTTEAITAVTINKAFCVIACKNDRNANTWSHGHVKVKFNSTTELDFNRRGTSETLDGHYYVVATAGTDFSVQHITMAPANGDETDTDTITAVTLNKTFVYNTYDTGEVGNDVKDAGWVIDLQDTTTVRARRAFDSFGGSPVGAAGDSTIEAQIISAGGTEFSVERAECDWADSLTKDNTITEIDQTKAIVVAGGYQGVMSATATGTVPNFFAILDFTSDTQVTGTRATNTSVDGTTFFEVVEFVLAGAAATQQGATSIQLVM